MFFLLLIFFSRLTPKCVCSYPAGTEEKLLMSFTSLKLIHAHFKCFVRKCKLEQNFETTDTHHNKIFQMISRRGFLIFVTLQN